LQILGVIIFQVRIHGRGGQGVVTAAELLSVAAFLEGSYAQAFPSFGSERMGAPLVSFCCLDDKESLLREPIDEPDALIIQDPTLLHSDGVFQGLNADGFLLIHSMPLFYDLGIAEFVAKFPAHHVCDVGATELAMKHVKRSVPNAALLGGFAAISGQLHMDSVAKAIMGTFPGAIGEANFAAAREAFDTVKAACKQES